MEKNKAVQTDGLRERASTRQGQVDLAIERHERIACAALKQDFHSRQHRLVGGGKGLGTQVRHSAALD
jgi:hypothetical protein